MINDLKFKTIREKVKIFQQKRERGKNQNMENMAAMETSTSEAKTSVISIVFT